MARADSQRMASAEAAQLDLAACFPHRICINLARRQDRWEKVQAQFQQHQIEVERWNAADGAAIQAPPDWRYSPGAYGCRLSHLEAVREARARGYESLLIFEDDVELHPELRNLFPGWMAQVPSDWDAIYFGGIHRLHPATAAPNVVRLVETNSTYAYALRNTVFDAFLSINERSHAPVDETAKALQKQFKFYCFWPHLAWVARDFSDVLGAEVNHWWLRDGLVTESEVIKSLAAQTCALLLPPSTRGPLETAVVEFTSRGICRLFPEVIAVSQRGETNRFGSARLPQNCRLWSVSKEALRDPVELMRATLDSFSPECNYVFLCEADVFVPQWELRASLLKSLQHDIVMPAEEPVPLTIEETQKALKSSGERVDTRYHPRYPSRSPLPGFVIASRRGLQDPASRIKRDGNGLLGAQTFRSPSRVLRLSTGG
jgi:glycosyl transferase, family 25